MKDHTNNLNVGNFLSKNAQSSKGRIFRVSIPNTPLWKICSIAKYKETHAEKNC
jgi:hypothetical protein